MVDAEAARLARERIASMFRRQVEYGRQSRDLQPKSAACGQFLEQLRVGHRGLHGTAAALGVLGAEAVHNPTYAESATRVLRFISENLVAPTTPPNDRARLDRNNVIKLSETLYALSAIAQSVERDQAASAITAWLNGGQKEGRAWSYFLDDQEDPSALPTAFAVRALAAWGVPLDEPIRYLTDHLEFRSLRTATDQSVQALIVFVLAYLPDTPPGTNHRPLRLWLDRVWRRLESRLGEDVEAHIEYAYDDRYYYVRLPWQLYLIAAASKLSPIRRFSSILAQRRLQSVTSGASSPTGFIYPYSGGRVAARTSGVIYDVLQVINPRPSRVLALPWRALERGRLFAGSPAFTVAANVIASTIVGVVLFQWLRGRHSLAELGPNVAVAIGVALLANRRQLQP